MRTTRPVAALAAAAALLIAGCTSGDGDGRSGDVSAATWVRQQDQVASAVLVPYDDPTEGRFLRITLDHGLSDAAVNTVVHSIKHHFDNSSDSPSLEVDVDGFAAHVYPGDVTFSDGVSDPDLARALWLRADGRATAYGYEYHSSVSSHPVVTAPAADVAQLALDYDAAVTHDHDVRRSESVESADGTTGVQWTTATGLGFGIDTSAVGEFARLQAAYPGTTGWVDCDGQTCKASVHFAEHSISLRRLLAGDVVRSSVFGSLELGRGLVLAPKAEFAATARSRTVRTLVADLHGVAGVARVGEGQVVVRNGTALAQVRSIVARAKLYVSIDLQRKLVLYGFPQDPVLTSRPSDSTEVTAAYTAVADLDGIAALELNSSSSFGNLFIDDDVAPAQLRTALAAVAALPEPYRETYVYASVPGEFGHDATVALGHIVDRTFSPTERVTNPASAPSSTGATGITARYAYLTTRVQQAWQAVRPR